MSKFLEILGLEEEILKEMLSLVYEEDILDVSDKHLEGKNLLLFTYKNTERPPEKINIHELANKYKSFMCENTESSIGSYYNKALKQWQSLVIPDKVPRGVLEYRIEAKTEPKAIFLTWELFYEKDEKKIPNLITPKEAGC